MKEYIEKQDAIDAILRGGITNGKELVDIWEIERIPAADVVPVVHGNWVESYMTGEKTRTCSICKVTQTVNIFKNKVMFKYCPYCGAKMDGGKL